jgi:putative addiction module component (TIGR02574 family)
MSKTLAEVTQDAAELPPTDRLKLARILIDLSDPEVEPSVDTQGAWDIEINKRLRELRSGKVNGIPLETVKARIKARYSK